MSDKDMNSSEMPKKKSRQSLKVTIKKNKFWIQVFTGGFVFVVVILCSWTGYNAFTSFKLRVVTLSIMFLKLSIPVIKYGHIVNLL